MSLFIKELIEFYFVQNGQFVIPTAKYGGFNSSGIGPLRLIYVQAIYYTTILQFASIYSISYAFNICISTIPNTNSIL